MTQSQAKKRSNAIDMVKGLSIMTLFFLHFEENAIVSDYNFLLLRSPAFYIIIGWLWGLSQNRRSVTEHWKKRLNGLVKPYIYFSLIFIIFDIIMVALQMLDSHILYRDIYKSLCLRGIGTLWFLPALLGGEIIFLYLRTKKLYIKICSFIFILILLYLLWNGVELRHNTLNNIINAPISTCKDICIAFIFISLTYLISRKWGKKILATDKKILFTIGIALYLCDFCIMNFYYTTDPILYIISSMLACIGILLLFTTIEHFKFISSPLAYCGRNSLIIMAVHYNLLYQITLICDKELLGSPSYSGFKTLIYFIIALFLQIIIIEFINRKVPFMIGK